LAALRKGLGEVGYVDGRNVAIEQRYGANEPERLPALAADLVRSRVAVLVAGSPPAARAAQAATATIPIVFTMGEDPVAEGIVTSLNRPGANITGFTDFSNQLIGKRLEVLHKIVPNAARLAHLVNPINSNAEHDAKEAQVAADALGRPLVLLRASSERDLDAAFAAIVQQQIGGLLVGVDGVFFSRSAQIAALAARYAIPAVYERREYPLAGGLISYGADRTEINRLAATYVGRILKGEKPADLPVQQSTKIDLVINLKTARTLGLTIPETLLATADEVIQ
jgi:putative tryptophan/tyrosine transport system substrate-binding protein